MLNTAEELGVLPPELNQFIDNPNRLNWYAPKAGEVPDDSGAYTEDQLQLNPVVVDNIERVLPEWRQSTDYARACEAAYEPARARVPLLWRPGRTSG